MRSMAKLLLILFLGLSLQIHPVVVQCIGNAGDMAIEWVGHSAGAGESCESVSPSSSEFAHVDSDHHCHQACEDNSLEQVMQHKAGDRHCDVVDSGQVAIVLPHWLVSLHDLRTNGERSVRPRAPPTTRVAAIAHFCTQRLLI